MLPANLSNTNHIKVAALLGLISAFLIFISMFIPIHLPLFFSGLPILIAYMAYDKHCGTITFLFISLVLFLAFPMEFFLDVFLDIIAPAALLGYLSIKNIEQNNKIWWYPESLLLRNFVVLSLISVVLVSTICYSEEVLLKASNEIINPLLQSKGMNVSMMQSYIASTIKYSIGMATLIKMFATLLSFNLAHIISKKIRKNIRPEFNFNSLKIDNFMAILPLVCLTIAQVFPKVSFLFSGLFVVGLFAPLICGFLVIHRFLNVRTRFILFFFLLVLTLPTILVIIILGIVDSFHSIGRKVSK